MKAIDVSQVLYYDAENRVTARMLADSLLGFEGIVSSSTSILKKLVPSMGKFESDVFIEKIEIGSYKECVIVRFLFGKGNKMEKKIEEFRKKLNLDQMTPGKLVQWAVAAAALYGIYLVVEPHIFGTDEPKQKDDPKPSVSIHFENSFNNLGKEVNMTGEEVKDLLKTALGQREELKKNAVKLVHPNGEAHSGNLQILNPRDEADPLAFKLDLPREVVSKVPTRYEPQEKEDPETKFDDVQIIVRASDLDRPDSGWAAVVHDVAPARLPMTLSEDVDAATVPVGKFAQADITVIYKTDNKGNKYPKKYLLRKVYSTAAPNSTDLARGR